MKRVMRAALMGASLAIFAALPKVAVADAAQDCEKKSGDEAVRACIEAIKRNPKNAVLFYNRGSQFLDEGDLDRAIADYNQAITLDPKLYAAYVNRGVAWREKGDLDRAIADYNRAMSLVPKFFLPYLNRGDAYEVQGDLDRANADYGQAIVLNPKGADAYFGRGRASLHAGALPKALADLNQASALDPTDPYMALWVDIAAKRSNLPGQLSEAVKQIDMTKWPAPVIRLYLGQMTPEAVLAAGDDPNAKTKKDRVCEANFYAGELDLQQGKKEEAIRLLRLAAADCRKSGAEYSGAMAELKALKVQ